MNQLVTAFRQNLNANKALVVIPDWVAAQDLSNVYTTSRTIDTFLIDLYRDKSEEQLRISNDLFAERTSAILERFKEAVIARLLPVRNAYRDSLNNPFHVPSNLFELAKCQNLYLSNKYTRVISESLGHYLEEIAELSPLVMNPEKVLGLKILGVDILIVKNGVVYYAQLKTKRDTLTGSQVPRSNRELSIHEHPLFVACLSLGAWTFNNNSANRNAISRLAGEEFWGFIGLNYDSLIQILSTKMQEIEAALHPTI